MLFTPQLCCWRLLHRHDRTLVDGRGHASPLQQMIPQPLLADDHGRALTPCQKIQRPPSSAGDPGHAPPPRGAPLRSPSSEPWLDEEVRSGRKALREERARTVAYKEKRGKPNRHRRISRRHVAVSAKDANRKGSERATQPQRIRDGEAEETTIRTRGR